MVLTMVHEAMVRDADGHGDGDGVCCVGDG